MIESSSPLVTISCPSICLVRMQLGGYLCEVDVRDPGDYTLHLGIGWFFGLTDPKDEPIPRCLGPMAGNMFQESNFIRSFIHGGQPIAVTLAAVDVDAAPADVPQFGGSKCATGDHPGRWLKFKDDQKCVPPFCTGDRFETIHKKDMVRGSTKGVVGVVGVAFAAAPTGTVLSTVFSVGALPVLQSPWIKRVWVWVPYDCYYHMYSEHDFYACAAKENVTWLHAMGDSQEREFMSHLQSLNGSAELVLKYQQVRFLCRTQAGWNVIAAERSVGLSWLPRPTSVCCSMRPHRRTS